MITFTRKVGEVCPKWAGLCWYDPVYNRNVLTLIPFNCIRRWLRSIRFRIGRPKRSTWWEKRESEILHRCRCEALDAANRYFRSNAIRVVRRGLDTDLDTAKRIVDDGLEIRTVPIEIEKSYKVPDQVVQEIIEACEEKL